MTVRFLSALTGEYEQIVLALYVPPLFCRATRCKSAVPPQSTSTCGESVAQLSGKPLETRMRMRAESKRSSSSAGEGETE